VDDLVFVAFTALATAYIRRAIQSSDTFSKAKMASRAFCSNQKRMIETRFTRKWINIVEYSNPWARAKFLA